MFVDQRICSKVGLAESFDEVAKQLVEFTQNEIVLLFSTDKVRYIPTRVAGVML